MTIVRSVELDTVMTMSEAQRDVMIGHHRRRITELEQKVERLQRLFDAQMGVSATQFVRAMREKERAKKAEAENEQLQHKAHCTWCGNLHPVIHHVCCANARFDHAALEHENERLRWALGKGLTESEVDELLESEEPHHYSRGHPISNIEHEWDQLP